MPPRPPYQINRRKWMLGAAAGGATLAAGAAAYTWRIEPHWVRVTHVPMPLKGLPDALVGRRLAQVSDLHVGPVVDNAYLRGALRLLDELSPDYLVLTGDFMTCRREEEIPLTIQTLNDSPVGKLPTFAILGNHDYGVTFHDLEVARRLTDGLEGLGCQVLRNSSTEIDGLQIAGTGDLWAGECDLYTTLGRVDHSRPAICLAHNPDIADAEGWTTFSGWILSGHTHGGQCRLPLLGAPILPVRNHLYSAGRIRLSGERTLYVNRGLGYKRRLRFGVRPEITVFTLQQA